jgi:hypothetical protein
MTQYPSGPQSPPPHPSGQYPPRSPDPYAPQPQWYPPQQPPRPPRRRRRSRGGLGAAVVGLLLVLGGLWILFGDQLGIDLDWHEVWPIGAVAIGCLLVVASVIPGRDREDA